MPTLPTYAACMGMTKDELITARDEWSPMQVQYGKINGHVAYRTNLEAYGLDAVSKAKNGPGGNPPGNPPPPPTPW